MITSRNPYFELLRINHWFKNVYIFVGAGLALLVSQPVLNTSNLIAKSILAFLIASVVSSANYVINQIADKSFDLKHPAKKSRPIPSERISVNSAFFFSIALFLACFFLSLKLYDFNFAVMIFIFWLAGILYNIKPIRLKDRPFVDVLSESINNPIRFLVGWFILTPRLPPLEFLLVSWSIGAIFMTAKRYDEVLSFGKDLIPYRHTFAYYSLDSLKRMLIFYSIVSFIFFSIITLKFNSEALAILPIALIYLLWLLRSFISGKAKAHNIEKFVLTRNFLIVTSLFFVLLLLIFLLT